MLGTPQTAAFVPALVISPGVDPANDPIETAWKKLEAEWDDDAAHKRFIAFCAAQGALAEAGRRYRTVRDNDDARAESAKKRIDAVLSAAMQTMQITREPPPNRSAARFIALAFALCVLAAGLLALLRGASP